jgi:hypothetical protein
MISLTYLSTVVELPNPLLNDTEFVTVAPLFYRTMDGDLRTYVKDVDASKFTLVIPSMDADSVSSFLAFVTTVDTNTCLYVDPLEGEHIVKILTVATEEEYNRHGKTQITIELEEQNG